MLFPVAFTSHLNIGGAIESTGFDVGPFVCLFGSFVCLVRSVVRLVGFGRLLGWFVWFVRSVGWLIVVVDGCFVVWLFASMLYRLGPEVDQNSKNG